MKKQESKPIVRTVYTQQELDSLFSELRGDMSNAARLAWLESKKAIKFKMRNVQNIQVNEMFVCIKPDGSSDYSALNDLWEALNTRENKKEFAKRMAATTYEKGVTETQLAGELF